MFILCKNGPHRVLDFTHEQGLTGLLKRRFTQFTCDSSSRASSQQWYWCKGEMLCPRQFSIVGKAGILHNFNSSRKHLIFLQAGKNIPHLPVPTHKGETSQSMLEFYLQPHILSVVWVSGRECFELRWVSIQPWPVIPFSLWIQRELHHSTECCFPSFLSANDICLFAINKVNWLLIHMQ